MAIEVFNRYENKYLLDETAYRRVTQEILLHMEPDSYNRDGRFYSILNLYYDTQDHSLIRNSLQKPVYKEKLRLRAYHPVKPEDMVFLEVKKKYHGLVNKRRTKIRMKDAQQFVQTGEIPSDTTRMNLQVLRELAYLVQHRSFIPSAVISYDRMAYFEQNNPDLRISFDTNLRGRRTNLSLTSSQQTGELLLDPGLYLMEIKTRKAAPLWLAHLLNGEQLRKTSFSKYGSFYQKSFA